MQRRIDKEDVSQQLAGYLRVDDGAGEYGVVKTAGSLKDYQGAGLGLGHAGAGQHGLVDYRLHRRRVGRRAEEIGELAAAHALEQAAYLGLEDDEYRNQSELHYALEQRAYHLEVQQVGNHQHQQYEYDAPCKTDGVCTPDETYAAVNKRSDKEHIDDVGYAHSQQICYAVGNYFRYTHGLVPYDSMRIAPPARRGACQFMILYNTRAKIARRNYVDFGSAVCITRSAENAA